MDRAVFVLFRAPSGSVDGLLTYRAEEHWDRDLPDATLKVRDLIAATPDAAAALWRYALSVDWVRTVQAPRRAPDDILPLLLGDPRAASVAFQTDFLWLRILDLPRLDSRPPEVTCTRTTLDADLTVDVADLATLVLGEESASRLAALNRVGAACPDVIDRADLLFRPARRPWCPDLF
jgi:predicted acetyltransferase